MSIWRITGGNRLSGSVEAQGSKNAVLPILAASVISPMETTLRNCPDIRDVDVSLDILRYLGCNVSREGTLVRVDSRPMCRCCIPHELMREMRSSVVFLGAILARCGEARMSFPGGCELGKRPVDIHLSALRALGAEVAVESGEIRCRADHLHGALIELPFPSVGATENAMLAACCAPGETVITNAAREPEIADLQRFLRRMGLNVFGAGTSVVTVSGKPFMPHTEHTILPDRIVTATWLCAAACAGGDITVRGAIPAHVRPVLQSLRQMGCSVEESADAVRLISDGELTAPRPVITAPYPGFPTDAQPLLMAAALRARGTTVFVENIFENRYRQAAELRRLGAEIITEGKTAFVSGVDRLYAAPVSATDLRGGAALMTAALMAEGTTVLTDERHIARGYASPEKVLASLGADIVLQEE